MFDLAGDGACPSMPKHTEIAGQLMRDSLSLCTRKLIKSARRGRQRCVVKKIKSLVHRGQVTLP